MSQWDNLLLTPTKIKKILALVTSNLDAPISGIVSSKSKSQAYTTGSGNFTVPAGVSHVRGVLVGGGGGAGSGARDATSTYGAGGSSGGAGQVLRFELLVTAGGTVAYSVGAGGAGGAAQSTATTAGNNGSNGGDTTFGAFTAGGG